MGQISSFTPSAVPRHEVAWAVCDAKSEALAENLISTLSEPFPNLADVIDQLTNLRDLVARTSVAHLENRSKSGIGPWVIDATLRWFGARLTDRVSVGGTDPKARQGLHSFGTRPTTNRWQSGSSPVQVSTNFEQFFTSVVHESVRRPVRAEQSASMTILHNFGKTPPKGGLLSSPRLACA